VNAHIRQQQYNVVLVEAVQALTISDNNGLDLDRLVESVNGLGLSETEE